MKKQPRTTLIFFDMDGVLAKYNPDGNRGYPIPKWKQNPSQYFELLEPDTTMISLIKLLHNENRDPIGLNFDINIISQLYEDPLISVESKIGKKKWINTHISVPHTKHFPVGCYSPNIKARYVEHIMCMYPTELKHARKILIDDVPSNVKAWEHASEHNVGILYKTQFNQEVTFSGICLNDKLSPHEMLRFIKLL